jgi:hypothetical protein
MLIDDRQQANTCRRILNSMELYEIGVRNVCDRIGDSTGAAKSVPTNTSLVLLHLLVCARVTVNLRKSIRLPSRIEKLHDDSARCICPHPCKFILHFVVNESRRK